MTSILVINWVAILISFFVLGCIVGAAFYSPPIRRVLEKVVQAIRRDLSLERVSHNPVLRPGASPWQAEAVFNPAAVILDGRTHLIYRSVGMDGISRLGYASSSDGLVFDDHVPYPAYVCAKLSAGTQSVQRYSPVMYPSGGSWGGCEDPRMVEVDGLIYLTINMFDGWDYIRTACISIGREDFILKRFGRWSAPTLLSRPGQRHKNWVLFPEKINGKFAILHSISPQIEIAYRDSLEAVGTTEPFIESWEGARSGVAVREGYWDNYVRSAGPPPLRTPHGWLLFYHANDKHEMHKYKLGAMLLDLDDPTRVLYRSAYPVLEPDHFYENDGKPGIVYACGSTIKDGVLYVYYGGADRVICVALAPLDTFLKALMASEHALLSSKPLCTT